MVASASISAPFFSVAAVAGTPRKTLPSPTRETKAAGNQCWSGCQSPMLIREKALSWAVPTPRLFRTSPFSCDHRTNRMKVDDFAPFGSSENNQLSRLRTGVFIFRTRKRIGILKEQIVGLTARVAKFVFKKCCHFSSFSQTHIVPRWDRRPRVK